MAAEPPLPTRYLLSDQMETMQWGIDVATGIYTKRICIGQIYRTSAISIPYATPVIVTWQGLLDVITSESPWNAGNPTRFTIPPQRSGYWQFTLAGEWEAPAANTNRLATSIIKNTNASEANVIARDEVGSFAGGFHSYTINCIHQMTAGETVLVELYHTHGTAGPLSWGTPGAGGGNTSGFPYQSRFTGFYLGPPA